MSEIIIFVWNIVEINLVILNVRGNHNKITNTEND